MKDGQFESEIELCRKFIESIPDKWVAYPETSGFDILLVHVDGWQIGVEAKMKLNANVITQIAPNRVQERMNSGPDYRAILIPAGKKVKHMERIAELLGFTVISMNPESGYGRPFFPLLPDLDVGAIYQEWFDWCPAQRCTVPEYVPDVPAGSSAPIALTQWKIGAIRLAVLMEKRGFITPSDFRHFKISQSRWAQERWIVRGDSRGIWIPGRGMPDFRSQHPQNYQQIEDDFENWNPDNGGEK